MVRNTERDVLYLYDFILQCPALLVPILAIKCDNGESIENTLMVMVLHLEKIKSGNSHEAGHL